MSVNKAARGTIGDWLRDKSDRNGDGAAVTVNGSTLTYSGLNSESEDIANGLRSLPLEVGDSIAVLLPNSPLGILSSFGVLKAGFTEIPINPDYRGPYLSHIISSATCKAVLCDDITIGHVLGVLESCPSVRYIISIDDDAVSVVRLAGVPSGVSIVSMHELRADSTPAGVDGALIDSMSPASIMFTSGTTGVSKGALYTHEALLNRASRVAEMSGFDRDTVAYTAMPLNHMSAKCLTLLAAMEANGRCVIDQKFSASRFWQRCRDEGVSAFNYVGALLMMLWKQPPSELDRVHRVAIGRGGGVPPELKTSFEERFGIRLLEMYGMTEFPHIAGSEWAPGSRPGSVGRVSPEYDVRIVGPEDYGLPAGETGEIILRPTITNLGMTSYYLAPEATVSAFRNLWFHTGDLGTLDSEGYLYYRGRKKDAIRRRGENISAWEVEQVVSSHPDVLQSCAFGVPSELTEEEAMVAMVVRSSANVRKIVAYCGERMPDFALPRYWRVVEALPQTATHSVKKDELRADGVTSDTWDRRGGEQAPDFAEGSSDTEHS